MIIDHGELHILIGELTFEFLKTPEDLGWGVGTCDSTLRTNIDVAARALGPGHATLDRCSRFEYNFCQIKQYCFLLR